VENGTNPPLLTDIAILTFATLDYLSCSYEHAIFRRDVLLDVVINRQRLLTLSNWMGRELPMTRCADP
jgi:hypothetical protein